MLCAESMAMRFGYKPVDSTMFGNNNNITMWDSIPHLDVWIEQIEFNPPTIRVEVTNENTHNVTFSTWNSPLDPEPIRKKILLETKHKVSLPRLNLPVHSLRENFTSLCEVHKKQKAEDLVELPPGSSIRRDHVFRVGQSCGFFQCQKARTPRISAVHMVGMWRGVWNLTKAEVLELPERDSRYWMCHWFDSNVVMMQI